MSNYFNKNVDEGLFNPKTFGTDQRITAGLAPIGQEYGQGAITAQRQALAGFGAIANGSAPSLAQMQYEQAAAQNQRAAMGLLGMSRGGNIAGAYGQALGAQQGGGLAAAQQGAMLRAQEQQTAYGNMAALGGQMAGQQFGYDQLFNQSELAARGQDLNYNLGKRGLDQQADQNAFNNAFQLGMAGANAAGSMAEGAVTMSDERAKVGLGALPQGGAGEAVAQVQPVAWDRYTDPSMGQGPRVGVSAQQLQGTSLGGLVKPGPNGLLQVDGAAAGTTALAASADQEHRLRAMEARLAQQDPYASPEMRTMGQEYERAQEGPYRTSLERRRQVYNQREAERGLGLVRSASPRDPFEGAPQMQRDVDPQYASITSQPGRYSSPEFTDSPSPFSPEHREPMQPRAMPRRRRPGLVQVEESPGAPMRATPVGDGLINYDRRAPIEPYRPGSAQALSADTMIGRRGGLLDPASQQMLDGANDYLNEWTVESTDELGRRRRVLLSPEQRDYYGSPTPVELQRQMDQLARDDEMRAIEDERARRAAMPQRAMVF